MKKLLGIFIVACLMLGFITTVNSGRFQIVRQAIVEKSEVGTMTGNETFLTDDGSIFVKDPGGAARNFDPSGTFVQGNKVMLVNTADAAENITFDSGTLGAVVGQNEAGIFVYNGSAWKTVSLGQIDLTRDAAVTVATLDTGQGANELYDMDQNVLTTSTPTFAGLTSGNSNFDAGANTYISIDNDGSANSDSCIIIRTGALSDFLIGAVGSLGTAGDEDWTIYSYGTTSNALTVARSTANVGIGDTDPTNGDLVVAGGVTIGTDSANNLFDDASNGSGSTTMYIGNAAIAISFTCSHYYQLGDIDLQVGELVSLGDDGKIYRTTTANDKAAVGVYWGITNWKDSFGNELLTHKTEVKTRQEQQEVEIALADAFEQIELEEKYIDNYTTEYVVEDDTVLEKQIPVYKTRGTGEFKKQLKKGVRLDKITGKLFQSKSVTVEYTDVINEAKNTRDEPVVQTDYAYSVACIGDSYEDHSETPLTGAWVTVAAGAIAIGDFLCASGKDGYLEKQADDIYHSYTVARAGQVIKQDTKTAYVLFLR